MGKGRQKGIMQSCNSLSQWPSDDGHEGLGSCHGKTGPDDFPWPEFGGPFGFTGIVLD